MAKTDIVFWFIMNHFSPVFRCVLRSTVMGQLHIMNKKTKPKDRTNKKYLSLYRLC
jgi:hypothetical protein